MRFIISFLIVLLSFSAAVVGQDSDEINRNEFYAGYLHSRSDDSVFSNGANGYNIGYTRNVGKYFGIRGEFAGTFKNKNLNTQTIDGPVNFETGSSFYTFHAGVQIKNNEKKGQLKPFAHALIGTGHNRSRFRCTPAANCGSGMQNFLTKETGFSAGIGGGLDLRINDRIDIRVIQAEYNPVNIGDRVITNFRFGAAIIIK